MKAILGFIFTIVIIVWVVQFFISLGKGAYYTGKAVFNWARNINKDTLQILEEQDPEGKESQRLKMVVCFVRLGILVAKADGNVSFEETSTIRNFFIRLGADSAFLRFVEKIIQESLKEVDYQKTIDLVTQIADAEMRLFLVMAMFEVSFADGKVDENELTVIKSAMQSFGYTQEEIDSFIRSSMGVDVSAEKREQALATLGLSSDANMNDIRSAYRKLAAQYHPDKLNALGRDFETYGKEKFMKISEAYQYLSSEVS